MESQPAVFTVSEISGYIKALLESDETLGDVWVRGEVSNFKRHTSSGHVYFTLKDSQSQINCAMWRERATSLSFQPQDGDRVLAHGNVGVYPPQGRYQLYVWTLKFDGIGALYEAFERLKLKLASEGLFDESRKKRIPPFPQRIGVITSADGAALRDIVRIARKRHPSVELILIPTLVQGAEAPAQIAEAISLANAVGGFDVLIVGRGGGSAEDLWAFNDEVVARSAAASSIPIVSAVGHETDFTIIDFVADCRAPTPTAAAQLVVPDRMEQKRRLSSITLRLVQLVRARIALSKERLAALRSRRVLTHPQELLGVRGQLVDELRQRAIYALQRRLWEARRRLETQQGRLQALSPFSVLQRGYALLREPHSGRIISRAASVAPEDDVDVVLWDGKLECHVEKVELNRG